MGGVREGCWRRAKNVLFCEGMERMVKQRAKENNVRCHERGESIPAFRAGLLNGILSAAHLQVSFLFPTTNHQGIVKIGIQQSEEAVISGAAFVVCPSWRSLPDTIDIIVVPFVP
jgi:hypothetical protein